MPAPNITITLESLERWTLRIGLIVAAIMIWGAAHQLFDNSNIAQNRSFLPLILLMVISGVLMLIAAASRPIYRIYHLIIIISFIATFLVYGLHYSVNRAYQAWFSTTDVYMFTDYGAELVRRGINPYSTEYADSYRIYRASFYNSTPTIDGDFIAKLVYPPLSLFPFILFQALGLDTNYIYPLFQCLIVVVLFLAAPRYARALVIIPILIDLRYVWFAFGGVNDSIWALFFVLTIVLWHRWPWSAVCFGLACATKQQTWLLIPFLTILLWHEAGPGRWRERLIKVSRYAVLTMLVFFVINLPFIVWDAGAWFRGVVSPFRDQMITLGMGIASLTTLGVVMIPRPLFTAFVGLIYATLLFVYARHVHSLKHALWIFPALTLWFGQRSLSSYWYYNVFPIAAAVLIHLGRSDFAIGQHEGETRIAPTAGLVRTRRILASPAVTVLAVTVAASLVLAGVVWSWSRNAGLSIAVQYPIQSPGLVNQLVVSVSNDTGQAIQPRFAVQTWSGQPLYWTIQDGPLEIADGASEYYRIRTEVDFQKFDYTRGAQVIVTDSRNDTYRASALIAPDIESNSIDGFRNGRFLYWSGSVPLGWGAINESGAENIVSWAATDVQPNAIRLTVPPPRTDNGAGRLASTRLDTWIFFPDFPIEVTVYVPEEANLLPELDLVYGLELESTFDTQAVWVLFGDESGSGFLESGQPYRMIATPRERWVTRTLDVGETFELLGLHPAPPQFVNIFRPELPFPKRMLNFRYLLAARSPTEPVSALFGPVRELPGNRDPLFAYSLTHQDELALMRGELNFNVGNYAGARRYFDQALAQSPENPDVHYWLGQIALVDGDPVLAESHFTSAHEYGYLRYSALSYATAKALFAQQRYEEARTAIEQSIAELDQQPYFYTPLDRGARLELMGWISAAQRQARVAEAAFSAAIVQDPRSSSARLGAGLMQMMNGNLDLGQTTLRGVTSLTPAELERTIGQVLADAGRCDLFSPIAQLVGLTAEKPPAACRGP